MEYLDRAKPSLKADVQLLSMFLLRLIEGQCVPDRKLNIETWSECEVASRAHKLIETSLPNTEPSPQSFADFEEADRNISLPESNILSLTDLGITSYANPLDGKEIDIFREDFDFT